MINGALLRDAVISAAITINNRKREVDELNVYPVDRYGQTPAAK